MILKLPDELAAWGGRFFDWAKSNGQYDESDFDTLEWIQVYPKGGFQYGFLKWTVLKISILIHLLDWRVSK